MGKAWNVRSVVVKVSVAKTNSTTVLISCLGECFCTNKDNFSLWSTKHDLKTGLQDVGYNHWRCPDVDKRWRNGRSLKVWLHREGKSLGIAMFGICGCSTTAYRLEHVHIENVCFVKHFSFVGRESLDQVLVKFIRFVFCIWRLIRLGYRKIAVFQALLTMSSRRLFPTKMADNLSIILCWTVNFTATMSQDLLCYRGIESSFLYLCFFSLS